MQYFMASVEVYIVDDCKVVSEHNVTDAVNHLCHFCPWYDDDHDSASPQTVSCVHHR